MSTSTITVTVHVNGEAEQHHIPVTIRQLVEDMTGRALDETGRPADSGRIGVAAALNGCLVPRSQWHKTRLSDADQVEIIGAVQGG